MRNFEDSTEAGGVAKAVRAVAKREQKREGKCEEQARQLFADATDDQMKDDGGIDGHGVAAPARAENAEVAAIDVEGGLESGEVSDVRHHAHANNFYRNSDALRHAVDGEVALDVVGFLSGRFDAGAVKGKRLGNLSTSKKSLERSTSSRPGARVSRLAACTVASMEHFAGS